MIDALESIADKREYRDGYHLGDHGDGLGIELEFGRFVYKCILDNKPGLILEVGTGRGYSTSWFLLGLEHNKKGILISVDRVDRSPYVWEELKIPTTRLIQKFSSSQDFLKTFHRHPDIVFLDTEHNMEVVMGDLKYVMPLMKKGIILIHDTNLHREMGDRLRDYFLGENWLYTEINLSCGMGIATKGMEWKPS